MYLYNTLIRNMRLIRVNTSAAIIIFIIYYFPLSTLVHHIAMTTFTVIVVNRPYTPSHIRDNKNNNFSEKI